MYLQWIGFITLMRKETIRIFRIWSQTLLPSVITTTLYFLIFGHFIGSRIGVVHGHSYIEFIVPGLIMMGVITNSYSNVASSVFGAKFQKNIEELLVSPMAETTILCGYLSGGVVRGCLIGLLITIVSLIFSPLSFYSLPLVIATIFLTAVLFSLAGFVNAIFAKKFDDISIVPTFLLTPLTYLGGVFYSTQFLPPLWRHLSFLNPVLHLVNIFRYGFLGFSDVPVIGAFASLVVLVMGLWALAWTMLKRGIGIRQ